MADVKLIDIESGVARAAGNMTLYKRLLGKYVEGNYLDELEAHLGAGSIPEAASDAHKIKGVAANLSLIRINEAALALETKLKAQEECAAELDELRNAHYETIAEIGKL